MSTVDQFMATGVQTLGVDNTLADAVELMEKYGCYHIPIVNSEGELQGVVSHRDVLRAMPSSLAAEQTDPDPSSVLVDHFMRREVITVNPQTEVRQAAMYLRNARIGCLPVCQGKKLVGIITDSDFIDIAVELLGQVDSLEPIAL